MQAYARLQHQGRCTKHHTFLQHSLDSYISFFNAEAIDVSYLGLLDCSLALLALLRVLISPAGLDCCLACSPAAYRLLIAGCSRAVPPLTPQYALGQPGLG